MGTTQEHSRVTLTRLYQELYLSHFKFRHYAPYPTEAVAKAPSPRGRGGGVRGLIKPK